MGVAAVVSILLFSLLHLTSTEPYTVGVVVSGLVHVDLFVVTGHLTASVLNHGPWSATAVATALALCCGGSPGHDRLVPIDGRY
ncbi:CPBP family intramembrane metalloprotease [Streptomonospora sp. PA3]|uniref:CPBP family intramembrane glutamic endopeptidase n=1 Tax=Streptomonospora sp. PA3 TaxID=2607326 RepID=UPI0012DEF105|nr:CPBP family intramembrane metalloprotease [Streptomonospora sp. PA3]